MADIILVVVGIIIIVVSFIISESDKDEEKEAPAPILTREVLEDVIDDLDGVIVQRFDKKFEERWEETIADADDQMGQISNEKIMAVNDFSMEVLEKIDQNHEDVIFLYKMLNDKEEELKQMAVEIDKAKNEWQRFYYKQKQESSKKTDGRDGSDDSTASKRREKIRVMDSLDGLSRRERLKLLEAMDRGDIIPINDIENYSGQEPASASMEEEPGLIEDDEVMMEEEGGFEEEIENDDSPEYIPAKQQEENLRRKREEKEKNHAKKAGNMAAFTGSNWNQEVLKLYKEGKTVQDISKLLKKGQGEVKLVLDLFQKVEAIH